VSDTDSFRIPTTPVAPGTDRRPWLVVATLVGLMAGAFVVARWTPGPDESRVMPTVRPTAALVAIEPVATALPGLEWFSAAEMPLQDVLVEADSVRWLRLASARVTDESLARPGRDLLLRAPSGGTVCLCWQGSRFETGDPRSLDLVRLDDDHQELSRTTIVQVSGFSPADRRSPTQVALEPSPDGRFAYLARATRAGTRWQVGLDVIDLAAEEIVDTADLVAIPQGDRSPVLEVEPPRLRIAPDGRHALVTSAIEREPWIGPERITPRAWIIDLDGSSLGSVVEVNAVAEPREATCPWLDFVAPGIVAQGCLPPAADEAAWFEIHRHGLDGRDLGSIVVPTGQLGADEPLLDLTNGVAYAWDPIAHRLASADLVGGTGRMAETPDGFDAPSEIVILGQRPEPGEPTRWSDGHSATAARRGRTLVGSSDGRLLFAIGEGPTDDSSSGVWVFDARTLELIERWPARAAYGSLALLEDGRWLAAIGKPGVDEAGRLARWGTSMTVHDTTTGRAVLRIGDLAPGDHVTIPWPPPLAAAH
jgi:hypothetical protein